MITHTDALVPSLTIKQFPGDSTKYLAPSWNDLTQLLFVIATQILAKQLQFDRIITLTKGGWPMSRTLVDFLAIESVATIGIKFYTGIDERIEKPIIYQDLPISVAGERVLLFDDVADTGKSLRFAAEYLQTKQVASLTTATVFYKPHSVIKPDFYAAESSEWIVFPYELVETLQILSKRWRQSGVRDDEVIQRFVALGFLSEHVEAFLPRY